jgi:hypothetical protein
MRSNANNLLPNTSIVAQGTQSRLRLLGNEEIDLLSRKIFLKIVDFQNLIESWAIFDVICLSLLSQYGESLCSCKTERSAVYVARVAFWWRSTHRCYIGIVLLVPCMSWRLDAERTVELCRCTAQQLTRTSLWCLHLASTWWLLFL